MGYLYEAMVGPRKLSIGWYYEDKGEDIFTRQENIWVVIDEQWKNTLYGSIHVVGTYPISLTLMHINIGYRCTFQCV